MVTQWRGGLIKCHSTIDWSAQCTLVISINSQLRVLMSGDCNVECVLCLG